MQRRIFLSFAILILSCVAFMAMSFGLLFFRSAQAHEMNGVRDKAYLVAGLLDQGSFEYVESLDGGGTRMSMISPDGWVFSDSYAGADLAVSRRDRIEFIQAITYGSGEAIRSSDTLGAETFYYAIRLQDGSVLRLSRTLHSLGAVFISTLPALFAVTIAILILAYFIAHRLTRQIIKPLIEVDFESIDTIANSAVRESMYEELWPYIRKIDHQKQEIATQLTKLRSRTETIEAIISNMREGLIIIDENGLVMAANKSVLDIFDISNNMDITQKNVRQIYRDPEFMQYVKECLDGAYLEMSFSRNDRVYKVLLSPVTGDENDHTVNGAIIFFLDTTEQFRAEIQRREFSANVSHELKTPLTTILALSEMMESGMAKSEDVNEFSGKIANHSRRLMEIIDDIIRLSEFDESKVERDFTAFDVHELAKSVIDSLQDKAAERSVTMELTGDSLQVKASLRLLDELIYNLLENGIKYNKDNGNIILDIIEDNGLCKITVTDTGIGIPKEHQSRIFERFYRVDSSRSKKTGGTGLGLSIVKHIAEHHNGRVEIDSVEGEGSVVVCFIDILEDVL